MYPILYLIKLRTILSSPFFPLLCLFERREDSSLARLSLLPHPLTALAAIELYLWLGSFSCPTGPGPREVNRFSNSYWYHTCPLPTRRTRQPPCTSGHACFLFSFTRRFPAVSLVNWN